MAVMALETGESFSPSIQNSLGYTGLIQFGKSTAEELGTTTDKLKKMNSIEQLNYVEKYLNRKKDKYKTLTDVYLSVLYPVACGKGSISDYIVFDDDSTNSTKKNAYWANPSFHLEETNLLLSKKMEIK